MLKIINYEAITLSINKFNSGYHNDYSNVNNLAKQYLKGELLGDTIEPLSRALVTTLNNWGAGKRAAPKMRSAENVKEVLADIGIREDLNNLKLCTEYLVISNGRRHIKEGAPISTVFRYDVTLIKILNRLSEGMLENNHGVTYPMKLVLLLSGSMPALDSQVRNGLNISGFEGMNAQINLPKQINELAAKKIRVLPFYASDCFREFKDLINQKVSLSEHPYLSDEVGRIFDILLFMHGRKGIPRIFNFNRAYNVNWYDI